MLESSRSSTPDLPEGLRLVDKRPAMIHAMTSEGEERLEARLTVVNAGDTPFVGAVVCIQGWLQVDCAPGRRALETELPGWTAIQHETSFVDDSDATIFAVLLIEDDRRGVDSVSLAHLLRAPDSWRPEERDLASVASYEIASPFPGCGVAAFHDERPLGDGYQLPLSVERTASLSVLVDACEEYGSIWAVPLLFADRERMIDVPWTGEPFVFGQSVQLPIAASLLSDVSSLQFLLLMHDGESFLSLHTPEVLVE